MHPTWPYISPRERHRSVLFLVVRPQNLLCITRPAFSLWFWQVIVIKTMTIFFRAQLPKRRRCNVRRLSTNATLTNIFGHRSQRTRGSPSPLTFKTKPMVRTSCTTIFLVRSVFNMWTYIPQPFNEGNSFFETPSTACWSNLSIFPLPTASRTLQPQVICTPTIWKIVRSHSN